MNDDQARRARRRITTGWMLIAVSLLMLFAGVLNILDGLSAGRGPVPVEIVLCVLGTAALLLGMILLIDGWTARWQAEQRAHESAQPSIVPGTAESRTERDAGPGLAGRDDRGRPAARGGFPGRKSLEEPATKRCPGCAKDVYKDARVCRYCGHAFAVTFRLKVYAPKEKDRHDHLVRLLGKKLSMPEGDVAHLLELGMRFKYDSPEKLAAARAKFEALGCRTQAYEKVGRE
jgi:hypothetical protein